MVKPRNCEVGDVDMWRYVGVECWYRKVIWRYGRLVTGGAGVEPGVLGSSDISADNHTQPSLQITTHNHLSR